MSDEDKITPGGKTMYPKPTTLDLDKVNKLLGLVEDNPGLTSDDLMNGLASWKTICHHIEAVFVSPVVIKDLSKSVFSGKPIEKEVAPLNAKQFADLILDEAGQNGSTVIYPLYIQLEGIVGSFPITRAAIVRARDSMEMSLYYRMKVTGGPLGDKVEEREFQV